VTRFRIDLGYDGAAFHGWASQPGLRTVQDEVERSIATILRLAKQPQLTCAGRTDAGVHARGQVAHVDLDETNAGALERRLRRIVRDDIRVHGVRVVPDEFDARFAALERRYVYRLSDHPAGPDVLRRGMVVGWPRPLDIEAMNDAATHLIGEHDFTAFCKRRDGASTIRTLRELHSHRSGETIETTVRADAFCHSMVRALMGCLVEVGERKQTPDWAAKVLAAGVRDPRVKVMPAHGLVLEAVDYPPDHELANRVAAARNRR
jgi:tRNA pseudouridine38-40 synthase